LAKLQTTCFSFVLLALGAGSAPAVELSRPEMAQAAVKKMAIETVECAAYFDIVSLALLHSNEGDTAQEYLKAREKAVDRAESLSQGIVSANYDVMIRDMKNRIVLSNTAKQIDQSLSNVSITDISVLGDQYAKLCKEVLSDPGARAKYWMGRVGTSQ
jgi:hypothetical protein